MDTGLYGGTFNPFHSAHLTIAGHVKSCIGLDCIYFIPCATPPHKPAANLAPAADRFEMIRRSIEGMAGFQVSDVEITREGPSFTIDTIQSFRAGCCDSDRLFLLMGSDAFFDIQNWSRKDDLFSAVTIVVMPRGPSLDPPATLAFIRQHVSSGYQWDPDRMQFVHPGLYPVRICPVPRIDISSTLIRNHIRNHRSITGLVPPPVATLIYQKDLYR